MRAIRPFRRIGLQLLSFGLGLSLWMSVAGEETVERGLRVPLELQQFPAGLEIMGDVPATVDVRVPGGSGVPSRLRPRDLGAGPAFPTPPPWSRSVTVTPPLCAWPL